MIRRTMTPAMAPMIAGKEEDEVDYSDILLVEFFVFVFILLFVSVVWLVVFALLVSVFVSVFVLESVFVLFGVVVDGCSVSKSDTVVERILKLLDRTVEAVSTD